MGLINQSIANIERNFSGVVRTRTRLQLVKEIPEEYLEMGNSFRIVKTRIDRGGKAESGERVGYNRGLQFVSVCLSEKAFIFPTRGIDVTG